MGFHLIGFPLIGFGPAAPTFGLGALPLPSFLPGPSPILAGSLIAPTVLEGELLHSTLAEGSLIGWTTFYGTLDPDP